MYVRDWKYFDPVLLLVMLVLTAYGLAMIYSSTYQTQGPDPVDPLVYRQLTSAAIGLAAFAVLALVDYHFLAGIAPVIYLGGLGLLGAVLALGKVTHGAQRWIDLGFFPLQASEPAKVAVILALAKLVSEQEEEMRGLRTLLLSIVIVGVPTLLTFAQPDLGTSLVFIAIWVSIALVGRAQWRYLGLLCLGLAGASPVIWMALHDYMRQRVLIFLDPSQDPLGKGYNIIQALIGVGSGGLWGRGFLSGTQSQLHFLRVQYADFIFSVLAEELGFIGAMLLLALFAVLAVRAMRIAATCREPFGRLVATAVITMIIFQMFVNIGMNISMLPATGIPLPFISYGGSSLISIMAALGLLQSIAMRHKRFES